MIVRRMKCENESSYNVLDLRTWNHFACFEDSPPTRVAVSNSADGGERVSYEISLGVISMGDLFM